MEYVRADIQLFTQLSNVNALALVFPINMGDTSSSLHLIKPFAQSLQIRAPRIYNGSSCASAPPENMRMMDVGAGCVRFCRDSKNLLHHSHNLLQLYVSCASVVQ
ncbi:unnamed protein product [Strongylus vulgaris]|uniref:Uncharacterized protein n=1 Tax=Strongylus vulgaris TaxID=40348 RepID=A0A3P7IZV3_STRVU|nr:unnamed protein product [Strongylus vulgaris]